MTPEQLSAWANVPDDEPFVYKTKAEQRLDWLKTRKRPLTDEEADELYRVLHAIYCRDRRLYYSQQAEQEATSGANRENKRHNSMLLEKVLDEATLDMVP